MSESGLCRRRRHGQAQSADPAVGSEAAKTRPAVVVSNNTANAAAARTGHGVLAVVPVTGSIERVYPF